MPVHRFRDLHRAALVVCAAAVMLACAAVRAAMSADELKTQRDRMVDEIAVMARETAAHTGRATFAPRVMEAMRRVERHRLVSPDLVREAYANRPLPIGRGQTISQPYIVALSTDLLDLLPTHRVLEIGTGSGYQAAVLAELVAHVSTIEIIESLGREAEARLKALGYRNVDVRIGDGYAGWPERAPFDRILVTAAAPSVPDALLAQLAPGGRMVIPIERNLFEQQLVLIEKSAAGEVKQRNVLAVRFVPMVRGAEKTKPR